MPRRPERDEKAALCVWRAINGAEITYATVREHIGGALSRTRGPQGFTTAEAVRLYRY